MKNKKEILEKLKDDEHYYGEYGRQFISNSDIRTLMTNPLDFKNLPTSTAPHFLIGGYFHTAILEPDKIKNFKVVEASSRNTKAYKEITNGEVCLLQHEVDMIEAMKDKMLSNDICTGLINSTNTEYEVPGVSELFKYVWKGKADIINHDDKLVVDIKTTADINKFKSSAYRYNYDSQAYIYRRLFGYDMLFIVIDKNTHQLGIFDCSDEFYRSGEDKVLRAEDAYELFYKTKDFNPKQYFISKTL